MDLGVKELRQRIGEVLERVARGEEITVLKRGKPAARIVPPNAASLPLPPLDKFRASIRITGPTLSEAVRIARDEERT